MLLAYLAISLLLIIAMFFFVIPLGQIKPFPAHYCVGSIFFMMCGSLLLYYYSGNMSGLNQWETTGRQHYQLLLQYTQLGGIDGIIARIKDKLKANPKDATGWFLLGKLYLMKNDKLHASQALQKARSL